ncbi:hypothetical protein B0I26_109133 [Anoxybacillus vitaminiphilus]|uniref:Lipoprotein n=1 Tax=Paranoxybacillus vitaminiphilus TaxID=581036 RepID=A0A327YET9_9BACL|nr:hypothetical protein [Anoxybacillus vitaminiphilus]RAK18712.1 hypothetical protein B0I26_109133 [Anoxybacillus vitaminiphilus]
MKRLFLLTLTFVIFIFLFGCSSYKRDEVPTDTKEHINIEDNNTNVDIGLVTSGKSLPLNFHEAAVQRKQVPYLRYLVKRTDDQIRYEELWNFFRLRQQIPKVNFDENDIFFIGLEESGSCPDKLGDVKITTDKQDITIHLSSSEGPCTDDATPRTFVIEVNKEISANLKNVIIVESGVKTTVPIDDN